MVNELDVPNITNGPDHYIKPKTINNDLKSSPNWKQNFQSVKKVLLVGYNGANNTGS